MSTDVPVQSYSQQTGIEKTLAHNNLIRKAGERLEALLDVLTAENATALNTQAIQNIAGTYLNLRREP